MIFRLLVKPFGNIWNLKKLCTLDHGKLLNSLYRFIYNAYQFEHGSSISYNATFLGIPNLPFGTKQIIITDNVRIGNNCTIFQQVTIQSDTLPNSPLLGSPKIGDNCYIYPGVKIIGNITIGDNVRIAPNVVITKDIPSNSLVQQTDVIVTPMKNDITDKYYTFMNNKWQYFQDNINFTEKNTDIVRKLNSKFSQ